MALMTWALTLVVTLALTLKLALNGPVASDAPTVVTHLAQISQTSIQGARSMMTWRNRAACLDEDPELFFPTGNTGPALLQIEEAKAVCGRCKVAQTCLEWAMESGQDSGVWGGLSEDERRALKRRYARARRAS
jgi:WhiB family transcriptional regulator, redox-sensing transcriptional regulator